MLEQTRAHRKINNSKNKSYTKFLLIVMIMITITRNNISTALLKKNKK